ITRLSQTVSSVSRLSSCGTTPSRLRIAGPSTIGFMPRTRSSPSVTGDTQAIMRMVVVLPAPLGPRKPNTSPRRTEKSMPSTATSSPKRLVSALASMRADAAGSSREAGGSDITDRRYRRGLTPEPQVSVARSGRRLQPPGGHAGRRRRGDLNHGRRRPLTPSAFLRVENRNGGTPKPAPNPPSEPHRVRRLDSTAANTKEGGERRAVRLRVRAPPQASADGHEGPPGRQGPQHR